MYMHVCVCTRVCVCVCVCVCVAEGINTAASCDSIGMDTQSHGTVNYKFSPNSGPLELQDQIWLYIAVIAPSTIIV